MNKVVNFVKRNYSKAVVGATALALSVPVFAEDAAASTTMIDVSKIDFTPLIVMVSAVVGAALAPMFTIAVGKKGLALIKSIINKVA